MCTIACEVARRNAVLPAAASRSTGGLYSDGSAARARIRHFGETIQRRPLGSAGPYCVPDAAPHVTSLPLLIARGRAARPLPRSNHRFPHQDASFGRTPMPPPENRHASGRGLDLPPSGKRRRGAELPRRRRAAGADVGAGNPSARGGKTDG